MTKHVYAIATMDTKGEELQFVADRLLAAGVPTRTVDVGTLHAPAGSPDVSRETVAACHPPALELFRGDTLRERASSIVAMSEALRRYLLQEHREGRVAGVIGLGGSGGTALITPAMRELPIGLPKIMVSTVASGHTAPYVGTIDLMMLYPVVDVAGLNTVSRVILANAAHAMAGMVLRLPPHAPTERPAVGLTMFGVTTPCVTETRRLLEAAGYDALVFHATGTGGAAMEKLVEAGFLEGVIDLTTTEVADLIAGGIFPCGPGRFDATLNAGIPFVLSLGALDMVNFGALESVPAPYRQRLLHVHNPQVTLMRTTEEENRAAARWIARKLNLARSPFVVLIPEGGVSALDAPGQVFYDPKADRALFEELEGSIEAAAGREIHRLSFHINDPDFARTAVARFLELRSLVGDAPRRSAACPIAPVQQSSDPERDR